MNRFDLDVRWISLVPVKDWLDPEQGDQALLLVHTRYSAILNIILSQKVDDLRKLRPHRIIGGLDRVPARGIGRADHRRVADAHRHRRRALAL